MRLRNLGRYGDIASDLSAALGNPATLALAAVCPTLTISTNLTPPLTVDLTGGGGGTGGGLAAFLQPTIVLNTAAGPVTIAPAGPSQGVNSSVGTWAMLAGLAVAGIVGFGYWLGVSASKPRSA